jgi:predicted transcriptional regulator
LDVGISTGMGHSVLPGDLSKRERQVVEIILRLKSATARDVERELSDPPTYSAVRSILRILVNKGLLLKKREADRDVYSSSVPVTAARTSVIRSFVKNFFGNSAGEAACALLGQKDVKLSSEDADRLMKLIKEARRK